MQKIRVQPDLKKKWVSIQALSDSNANVNKRVLKWKNFLAFKCSCMIFIKTFPTLNSRFDHVQQFPLNCDAADTSRSISFKSKWTFVPEAIWIVISKRRRVHRSTSNSITDFWWDLIKTEHEVWRRAFDQSISIKWKTKGAFMSNSYLRSWSLNDVS